MTTRRFHLGEILTATTGIYLCPDGLDGFIKLVDYVTGQIHFDHQLGRAGQDIAPYIRGQLPWTAEITVPPIADETEGRVFLAEVADRYGEFHVLEPMPEGMYVGREPIAELREMVDEGGAR